FREGFIGSRSLSVDNQPRQPGQHLWKWGRTTFASLRGSGWAGAVRTDPVVAPFAIHQPPPRGTEGALPIERLAEWLWLRRQRKRCREIATLLGPQRVGRERDEEHRAAPREQVEPLL